VQVSAALKKERGHTSSRNVPNIEVDKMSIKVMTLVGTRPEIIKLSRVIHELEKHTKHILVHSGQNYDYELNDIFFQQLGIKKPDYYLDAVGNSVASTIGNIITRADEIMAREKPDALLLYGDTNTCLAVIPAKRRKIPVFHMEAGNRCFDQRVPEEINRKIVDHLSDINIPLTEHARRYLLAEGIKPETVIKTGSVMMEVLNYYMPQIRASNVLSSLNLTPYNYLVVSAHREENIDFELNFNDLLDSLNAIAQKYNKPIIVSTHPRTKKKIEQLHRGDLDARIRFHKPLGFFDYIKLQMHSYCVVSDSGTITEESSILNFPAVTIRYTNERPEGMDEGTLIMCGLKPERVLHSIDIVTSQHIYWGDSSKRCVPFPFNNNMRQFKLVPDYNVENVSKKVLRIIISYIDYVNRTVWYK
jgi:UDP-N-acetylglucosamine 2-epimerase (non-hydrolysing)